MNNLGAALLWFCAAACVGLIGAASAAETYEQVFTRDNRLYSGVVVETESGIQVQFPGGSVDLTLDEIESRNLFEEPNALFNRRLSEAPEDTKSLIELANEAREALAFRAIRQILKAIIQIDPDHAEARTRLGYEKIDGAWLPRREARYKALLAEEETAKAKGLVEFRGKWIAPGDRRHLSRGDVLYDGEWMTLEERDQREIKAGKSFVMLSADQPAAILCPDLSKPYKAQTNFLAIAAKDLADHLEYLTGHSVPIIKSLEELNDPAATNLFRVGQSALPDGVTISIDETIPRVLQHDILVKHVADKDDRHAIVLAGPTPRATAYAVYTFLRDVVGIRWYFPGEEGTVYPTRRQTLTLPAGLDIQESAALSMHRSISPAYLKTIADLDAREQARADHRLWSIRNRLSVTLFEHHHSYKDILPPENFEEHPEWFSMLNNERRAGKQNVQICTTNQDVIDRFVETFPGMYGTNPAFAESVAYPLCANDMRGWCECAKCRALDGGPYNFQNVSRRIATFTNAVAEQVAPALGPHQVMSYYLYNATLPPFEGATLHEKIVPMICRYTTTDFTNALDHPLNKTGGGMTDFSYLWEFWNDAALSKKMVVYEYLGLPEVAASTMGHSADNLRFYIDGGADGVFYGVQKRLETALIEAYLAAQLMWNSELDDQEILADFYSDFYGNQALLMRRHFIWFNHLVGAQFGQTALIYSKGAGKIGRLVDLAAADDWPDDVEQALTQATDPLVKSRIERAKKQKDVTVELIRLFAEKEKFETTPTPESFKRLKKKLINFLEFANRPDMQLAYPRTPFLNNGIATITKALTDYQKNHEGK